MTKVLEMIEEVLIKVHHTFNHLSTNMMCNCLIDCIADSFNAEIFKEICNHQHKEHESIKISLIFCF